MRNRADFQRVDTVDTERVHEGYVPMSALR
jgi:hypothetical protein